MAIHLPNKPELKRLDADTPCLAVWSVPSTSQSGTIYFVVAFQDGHVECSCKGHQAHDRCWHTVAAIERNDW